MLPQVIKNRRKTKKYRKQSRKNAGGRGQTGDQDRTCATRGCTNPAYARVDRPERGSIVVCEDDYCMKDFSIIEVFDE